MSLNSTMTGNGSDESNIYLSANQAASLTFFGLRLSMHILRFVGKLFLNSSIQTI